MSLYFLCKTAGMTDTVVVKFTDKEAVYQHHKQVLPRSFLSSTSPTERIWILAELHNYYGYFIPTTEDEYNRKYYDKKTYECIDDFLNDTTV